MRRLVALFICFAGVFGITLGSVAIFSEPAMAMYCDVYSSHLYHSDDSCTDKLGNPGVKVYQCEGYSFLNGVRYHCGCYLDHCEIFPDDKPYQEPQEP